MLRADPTLQAWYALVVLYVAEWPTYARHGNGGDAYLKYLRSLAEKFEVPRHAAVQVQMLFAEELSCGTPSFFLEGVGYTIATQANWAASLEDSNMYLGFVLSSSSRLRLCQARRFARSGNALRFAAFV